MGTWDAGPFDNDTAQDLLASITAGNFDFLSFRRRCESSRVGADDAEACIALGALAKMPMAKRPTYIEPGFFSLICSPQHRAWLRKQINRALEPESSELYGLWEETGELHLWERHAREALP